MSIKKAIIVILTLLIVLVSFPVQSVTAAFNSALEKQTTYSEILLLVSDLGDDTVIFEKNADLKTAPASLTKIVVAALVLENCPDLDIKVTVPAYAIRLLDNTNSSNVNIKPGEEMSVYDLLSCMLIASANDAANVLAHHVAGNIDDFVPMMNDYVKSLGCKNTVFKNAHGLDEEGQYTTANDVLLYTKAALKYPVFEEITSKEKHTIPATNLSSARNLNTTVLLMNKGYKDYYYQYASGIKTGSTKQAGRCSVSRAGKDGYSYVAIVMRAPLMNIDDDAALENCAFIDSKTMYKWVFEHIRLRKIADTNRVVGELPVKLSRQTDHIQLVPREDYKALMPLDDGKDSVLIELIEESLPKEGFVRAPLNKGDFLAKARVLYAGEEIYQIDLVAAEDVKLSKSKQAEEYLLRLGKTFIFKIIFALLILAFSFYLLMRILRRHYRKKKRGPRLYSFTPGKNFRKKK